jgi:hypothetical protein
MLETDAAGSQEPSEHPRVAGQLVTRGRVDSCGLNPYFRSRRRDIHSVNVVAEFKSELRIGVATNPPPHRRAVDAKLKGLLNGSRGTHPDPRSRHSLSHLPFVSDLGR